MHFVTQQHQEKNLKTVYHCRPFLFQTESLIKKIEEVTIIKKHETLDDPALSKVKVTVTENGHENGLDEEVVASS